MEGEDRHFSSPQEECAYWKDLAKQYKTSLEDTREELEEFQISSRELEAELEAQLEQQECRNKDISASQQRLQMEVESLREKLEQQQGVCHRQMTEMADELAQIRAHKEELAKYIRELEQSNDDLERTKRATVVSLEDFESRLNQAIERNAFLESELEERESLTITVQRLKDEARDLRQELAVKKPEDSLDSKDSNEEALKTPKDPENKVDAALTTPTSTDHIDSNKLMDDYICATPPNCKLPNRAQNGSTPLTPAARISALNIVGDLLRKVGALESKLASCRNVVNNQSRSGKSGASSPLNSPSRELYMNELTSSGGGVYRNSSSQAAAFRAKRQHRSNVALSTSTSATTTTAVGGGIGASGAGLGGAPNCTSSATGNLGSSSSASSQPAAGAVGGYTAVKLSV